MSYYLFLDDERYPKNVTWVQLPENVEWVIVRDFRQFVRKIEKDGLPAFISFDHDLAEEHYTGLLPSTSPPPVPGRRPFEGMYNKRMAPTGYDCLYWLVETKLRPTNTPLPPCTFHTMNPVGKQNMENYARHYNETCQHLDNCKKK